MKLCRGRWGLAGSKEWGANDGRARNVTWSDFAAPSAGEVEQLVQRCSSQ